MGWHMKFVICVQLAYVSVCLTREMSVVREWISFDLQFTSVDGQESRRSINPSSNVYSNWLLYKDRLFVIWNRVPPYSNILAYLDLTDNSTSHTSYEIQQIMTNDNNVNDVRVDRCDRLWVSWTWMSKMDYGKHIIISVIDLKTDSILRNITFSDYLFYYDIIVDDFDCDNEYVYISSPHGFWTYSWAEGDSWGHISSYFMSSMVLAPNSIVYFNEAYEPMVYYMSTTHLRDKSNKTIDISGLGRSRELNANLDSSALDAKSDVLYYFNNDNKTVIHAVPCWTSERCSTNCQDDVVVSIDPTHELNYITVDENGDLWAITSRSSFEYGEINFRLLSVPVRILCVESNANDTTNTSTDVESITIVTTNTSTRVESNTIVTTNTSTGAESNTTDTTNTSTGVESNTIVTTNTSTGVESNTKVTTNTSTRVESNTIVTTNTSTGAESNTTDTTNTSTGVESNTIVTTNTSTGVESNTKVTTNTSTGVESNTKVTTNKSSRGVKPNAKGITNKSSRGVKPNAKGITNTMNIDKISTPASSATEQTSTPGSVHKHTTANIADTTAGTPNSNITQAVGGTNVPHLLFSFTNTTFNLSNFTIINNFPNNNFH